MNLSPTPVPQAHPAASTKTKWRLWLLAVVAAIALLPALLLLVRPLAKPPVMQVSTTATKVSNTPAGSPADALTILVGSGNHLYYYVGKATPAAGDSLHAITPSQPIRQVVKAWQQHSKSSIYIKPVAQDNYKALVDLLDEMNLAGQRSYAVVVPTAADNQLLLTAERR